MSLVFVYIHIFSYDHKNVEVLLWYGTVVISRHHGFHSITSRWQILLNLHKDTWYKIHVCIDFGYFSPIRFQARGSNVQRLDNLALLFLSLLRQKSPSAMQRYIYCFSGRLMILHYYTKWAHHTCITHWSWCAHVSQACVTWPWAHFQSIDLYIKFSQLGQFLYYHTTYM